MYNPTSISKLMDRIGWAAPVPPTTISLSAANAKSDSGRFFNSFHRLVVVENVFASIPNEDVTVPTLQAYLEQIKKDAVLEVLNRVFDLNERAAYAYTDAFISTNYMEDYSDVIISKSGLFDEAIGYSAAIKSMQLFLGTPRSNVLETTIGLNYTQLKGEIEGFFNEYGKLISKGTTQNFEAAIIRLIEVLFPVTQKNRPTLSSQGNKW